MTGNPGRFETGGLQLFGQNPEFSKKIDLDRVFELLLSYSGLKDKRLALTDTQIKINEERQANAQASAQAMQAIAQNQANQKLRAETAPVDTLINAMNAAPDNSILKIQLISTLLKASGTMNADLQQAIDWEMQLQKTG